MFRFQFQCDLVTVIHVNMAAIARTMERSVLSASVLMVSKVSIVQRKVRYILIAYSSFKRGIVR